MRKANDNNHSKGIPLDKRVSERIGHFSNCKAMESGNRKLHLHQNPLMKESTATITYKDKGKGKATKESSAMLEYSQVVAAQEVHQLIKESMVSSSATTTIETLQEAKPKNARRGKIY